MSTRTLAEPANAGDGPQALPNTEVVAPANRMLLPTVCLASLPGALNFTMLVVALPVIADSFEISVTTVSWILIIPMLVSSTLQSVGGRLGDVFGYRRVFLGSITAFIIVSMGAALAPTFWALVALRVLQVAFGAATSPNGGALVRLHLPAGARAGAFGAMTASMSLAMTVGPVIGGVLATSVSWRAIFLINVPLALLSLLVGLRAIPPDPPGAGSRSVRFDVGGALLLFASMLSLIVPLTLLRYDYLPLVWLPVAYLALSGVVAAFVRRELRHPDPLVQVRLFARKTYRSACISDTLFNVSQFPIAVVISIYVQTLLDRSSLTAGIVIAVGSMAMILFSPVGGRLADRFGRRTPALVGRVIAMLGAFALMLIDRDTNLLLVAAAMTIVSVGGGLSYAAVQAAAIESAPRRYSGMAAGVFATTTFTGGIVGITAVSIYLDGDDLAVSQFQLIFLVFALTAALSAIVAARLEPWPRGEGDEEISSSAAPASAPAP